MSRPVLWWSPIRGVGWADLEQLRTTSTLEQSSISDLGIRRAPDRTCWVSSDFDGSTVNVSIVEECSTVAKGKRTFQPNNRRRARVHGFRLRMRTRAGRAIVSARRRKGRASLTA